MRTHHDIENERENRFPGVPSVPGQEVEQGGSGPPWQPPHPSSPRPPNRRWFVVLLVSMLVVLLVAVGVGTIALVQISRQHITTATPTPGPTATVRPTPTMQPTPTSTSLPTRQWIQVLTGYHVTELQAAPSNPSVLYACAVPPNLPFNLAGVQTVLRSADLGTHWQDIGSRAGMSRGCELTINPTDSYEIYVSTSSSAPEDARVPSFVLKHTINGGDSWETIQHPLVYGPGLQIPPAWKGFNLSLESGRLYSLQSLLIPPQPAPPEHQGPLPTTWTRLLMSTDGGQSWGVLDRQLARTWQTVWGYKVNPGRTSTIYELVSPPGATAGEAMQAELYQSTDRGVSWQPLIQSIPGYPRTAEIYIGRQQPDLLYLRAQCPTRQVRHTGSGGGGPLYPSAGGVFDLCMSIDGGSTWRAIPAPAGRTTSMDGGLIDSQGRFYTYTLFSATPEVWRFDPANQGWERLTTEPARGTLLQATSIGTSGNATLWFLSGDQAKPVLYRYDA